MTIPFREFPSSYRLSQSMIGFALVASAFAGPVIRVFPGPFKFLVLAGLGSLVIVSLVISNYVIIRYPYISLIEPDDGDPFSRHYASHGSWIYVAIKILWLIVPTVVAIGICMSGVDNVGKTISLVYCAILAPFMLFFLIFYEPVRHPTVATFVRSTMGLGTVLYPLFAVSIFVGALRCNRLLQEYSSDH